MIIIYDFDGTLTPFSFPQYEVLKICEYDDRRLLGFIKQIMAEKNIDLYEAFCETTFKILDENGIDKVDESVYRGAEDVEYNKGVIEYFEKSLSDVHHYVVTSGFEEFVRKTKISRYLSGIVGTRIEFTEKNYKIERLMTDEEKVVAIKDICNLEKCGVDKVIYIGDGLTDKYAFEFIHNNGGESIFISDDENDENYIKLQKEGIIDFQFNRDFSEGSALTKHIAEKLEILGPIKIT